MTCENKELYRTNKILLAQIQDLQYDQVNHDELVEDLEDEIANLKVDVADLEIEKKDLEDENGELQEKSVRSWTRYRQFERWQIGDGTRDPIVKGGTGWNQR